MALLSTDPVDLLLDSSGDLVIAGGDLVLAVAGNNGTGDGTNGGGVAQLVRIACGMVRGEWFADLDAGVPYLERDGVPAAEALLGEQFDAGKAQSAFRDAILSAAGVGEVVSLVAAYDGQTRVMTVTWTVRTLFGDTFTDSLSQEA